MNRDNEKKCLETVLKEKVENDYKEKMNVNFTWKRLFLEVFLIGKEIMKMGNFIKSLL